MHIKNRISSLFNIEYPIIQGGMVWASGWRLVSAVSNCGGLGLIGAGSMKPDLLKEHITKCKTATQKPFGVNIPLLRGDAEELVNAVIEENIKIVFTSAGNPSKFINKLKDNGCKVVHVVSSLKFALKAEDAGCDAIVAEGVEAGGHNGLDEITTFCLIPQIVEKTKIPVIAAGGVVTGSQVLALLSLGAEGVQIGTAFAATEESSLHQNYKNLVTLAGDNSTELILKKVGMARVIKTNFSILLKQAELDGKDTTELKEMLGKKREMLGMFEGDLENGLFEAGQGVGLINEVISVKEYFEKLINEFDNSYVKLGTYR